MIELSEIETTKGDSWLEEYETNPPTLELDFNSMFWISLFEMLKFPAPINAEKDLFEIMKKM